MSNNVVKAIAVFALIQSALFIATVTAIFFEFHPQWLLLIAGLSLFNLFVWKLVFRRLFPKL